MLYRPPRNMPVTRVLQVVRQLAARLRRRDRGDEATLAHLSDHRLRDLGIRHVEARGQHRFY